MAYSDAGQGLLGCTLVGVRRLMFRPSPAARLLVLGVLSLVSMMAISARAEDPDTIPGQFFSIDEPIVDETLGQISASTKQFIARSSSKGREAILVFEIRPGRKAPGQSRIGASYDLAEFLSTKLEGAKQTVAFVPEPLTGYAVLAALACDEIVMGQDASLGPITPDGQDVKASFRETIRQLAQRTGRQADLLLGMLDKDADLRAIRTADKQLHYVLAENLPEFEKSHQVIENVSAWEGGRRGVLTAKRARAEGFAQLLADQRIEVANRYRLAGQSSSDDPTLGQVVKPVWIAINGPIDGIKESYVRRRIEQAREEQVNLLLFQINSDGGADRAADNLADTISRITDMKTVAYIDDRAVGVSTLVALACDDIVFRKGGEIGGVNHIVVARNGQAVELSPSQREAIADRAENLAEMNGHSGAVARAMVDPQVTIIQCKDTKTGAVGYFLPAQLEAEPDRYVDRIVKKAPGQVLTLSADDAVAYGLGEVVPNEEEFKAIYGLKGKDIKVNGPTWVDALVTTLNDPFVSWVLLFVGLFMLILELKLPGIGLPAITSALAFLLFFWSRYLSGTADQLEIMLFVVGMVSLALELFVFPGFGVFGMSGILLILVSLVMASHTFIWPTQEYEYRQMGQTLFQITLALAAVAGGAVVLGRYFPSIPLFNRLILKPEPWDADADPNVKPVATDGLESLYFLIGETGRTTTTLRPSGKARFGDLLIDVSADGFFVEPDTLIEVVDVQGSKVIVKRVDS